MVNHDDSADSARQELESTLAIVSGRRMQLAELHRATDRAKAALRGTRAAERAAEKALTNASARLQRLQDTVWPARSG